jgi:hypothetical protein
LNYFFGRETSFGKSRKGITKLFNFDSEATKEPKTQKWHITTSKGKPKTHSQH